MVTAAEPAKATEGVEYLRADDVLKRYTWSKSTLYRALSAGTFPPARRTPGGPRWSLADLKAWERALKPA